jgi:hypothetical protein
MQQENREQKNTGVWGPEDFNINNAKMHRAGRIEIRIVDVKAVVQTFFSMSLVLCFQTYFSPNTSATFR